MSFKKDETGQYIATDHFKMPKSVKRTLASIKDKDKRDQWRKAMAQSVMQSFDVPVKKEKKVNGKAVVEQE